jgi:hypothetical protein
LALESSLRIPTWEIPAWKISPWKVSAWKNLGSKIPGGEIPAWKKGKILGKKKTRWAKPTAGRAGYRSWNRANSANLLQKILLQAVRPRAAETPPSDR